MVFRSTLPVLLSLMLLSVLENMISMDVIILLLIDTIFDLQQDDPTKFNAFVPRIN